MQIEEELLQYTLKVIDAKSMYVIGTAFLVDNNHAITAQHVIAKASDKRVYLESHDSSYRITKCEIECELKLSGQGIDISVVQFNDEIRMPDDFLSLSKDKIDVGAKYETYGYPELLDNKRRYISGTVISPEGRLDIINSNGENVQQCLYSCVSGAPFVVDGIIYGVIVSEGLTTAITKPELRVFYFNNIFKYIDSLEMKDEEQAKLYDFFEDRCIVGTRINKKIDPFYKMYDSVFQTIKDKRNIREKVRAVCPKASESMLRQWKINAVAARIELDSLTSEQRKAVIMAVYISCNQQIDKINYEDAGMIAQDELRESVEALKVDVKDFVDERKKDYNFGVKNNVLFENTIFNLIDSCFISFDSY